MRNRDKSNGPLSDNYFQPPSSDTIELESSVYPHLMPLLNKQHLVLGLVNILEDWLNGSVGHNNMAHDLQVNLVQVLLVVEITLLEHQTLPHRSDLSRCWAS